MKVRIPAGEKAFIILISLLIMVLGLSLILQNWQNVRQQKKAMYEHILLAARTVSGGIGGGMMRGLRGGNMGRMGSPPQAPAVDQLEKTLQEFTEHGDLLFAGIYTLLGKKIVSYPSKDEDQPFFTPQVWQEVRQKQEWSQLGQYSGRKVIFFARIPGPRPREKLTMHNGRFFMNRPPQVILVIALDIQHHIQLFSSYRRAALWQTMYLLLVFIVIWSLALAFLHRKNKTQKLEKELNEAERLAAIGRLAAGVAHEIRNPLSSLRGFAQYFAGKLKGQEPAQTYALTMVSEADRLNRVITDLLFLSRPKKLNIEDVDLKEIILEVQNLLGMDLQKQEITWTSDLKILTLKADRDSLKQVLINLLMNSLSALPSQEGQIKISSQTRQNKSYLCIHDNGQGMDEQTVQRILEPFFTTKDSGTGLGLAIVHRIVQDHGAEIKIDSTLGQGTKICLIFP